MNRRGFLSLLPYGAAGLFTARLPRLRREPEAAPELGASQSGKTEGPVKPQIAITMDDPRVDLGRFMTWQEANGRLLQCFAERNIKVALFVCGMRVDHPEGADLLNDWNEAGHLLCNHSYSHLNFNAKQMTYDHFAADFLRDEPILQRWSNKTSLFRYPALKEGNTADKRDRFRALLKMHGFRVGHVTIDTSDWYVDQRMQERLAKDATAAKQPYRDYLISHLLDRASFYRKLSLDVLGREIPHTILVHYTQIEALYLEDAMNAFEKAGWDWIDADKAFSDPVFSSEPQTLPAGESLVWALAKQSGRFEDRLRYPGEDDVYEKPKMNALGL